MDLPKEEVTSKRMAVAVVKGDELFLVQSDLGLSSFRFNANHFQPTDQSSAEIILADQTILKTRTGHGIPMRAGELKPSLARLDPSDVFLTVAISRDSFGSFADLRSTCVELGLEYSILPVSKFPIAEGPTSQLPKAQ
jgi:hypothetical protein